MESGYSSDKQNTGESDGTSPSIGAAGGEAVEDKHSAAAQGPAAGPEQGPTSASPAAVSVPLTASGSPSPTASASPCVAESPTAPVSSGGPTSPSTMLTQAPAQAAEASGAQPAQPAEDWSSFHTPEHGDAYNGQFNGQFNGQPQPRCFTPVDEELRITIPESGEGSIHISPVQPADRPASRRGFFPGDTRRSGGMVGGECESGVGPDFTPELENRLLSLCLSSNREVGEEVEGNVDDGAMESTRNVAEMNETRRKIDEWYDGQKAACPVEDIESNNNNNNNGEDYFQESKSSKCKTNLMTDRPTQHSASGDSTDNKNSWCKTLSSRQQTEEGECSVISCLNQFTSVELMTGNNKVGCDACTQRQNKGMLFPNSIHKTISYLHVH